MIDISKKEIWFVVGSQNLYGEETLKQVAVHSQEIAKGIGRLKKTKQKCSRAHN